MTLGITNTGLSGLFANQIQIETAGHNLANATVEGYHRQRVDLATRDSLSRGGFFVGRGVDVQTVQRVFDRFAEAQLQSAKSDEAYLDTLQQQVNQVINLLADGGDTLNSSLLSFFGAFSALASAPTSQPQRQLVLASGSSVASAFATLQRRLDGVREGLDSGIDAAVTQLNDAATNLARVNVLINEQSQVGAGPAPDLLDSRDRLVARISSLVNARSVIQSNGAASVQIADGRTLVEAGEAVRVSAEPAPTNPAELTMYIRVGGVKTPINEFRVTSGTLGGLFEMRNRTLNLADQQLGRMALSVAAEVNEQHKSGVDQNGATGQDIFLLDANPTDNTPETIVTQLFSNATTYATTVGRPVQPSIANAGSANLRFSIPVDSAAPLATRLNSLRQLTGDSYSIVYRDDGDGVPGAADFRVTALPSGRAVTPTFFGPDAMGAGSRLEFDGLRIAIDDFSRLRDGDAFEVRPTAGFAGLMALGISDPRQVAAAEALSGGVVQPGDGRNAQKLANLQRAGVIGSTDPTVASTFAAAFAELAGTVGVQAESAKLRGNAQTALVKQLVDQQQSLSGVNLDEEAANLLRYQQAYQASAKLVSVAGSLLQAVLDII